MSNRLMNLEVSDLAKAMSIKGHRVFENDTKNFNLNYVGVRDAENVGDWNDAFFVFWKYKGLWSKMARVGTTDPGLYYMQEKLLNPKGAAIHPEGQFPGILKLGLHQNKYEALVQAKELGVHRDNNMDGTLDFGGTTALDTGMHGINHHRALTTAEVAKVGKFSAGCQVTLNIDDYNLFLQLVKVSMQQWGNTLTYTLMNINDF